MSTKRLATLALCTAVGVSGCRSTSAAPMSSSPSPSPSLAAASPPVAFTLAPLPSVTAYEIHSMDRPVPPVVDPGAYVPTGRPPADAIVLFDGRDLGAWERADSGGGPAGWRVADGYMEVVAQSGSIQTRRGFGDMQLHLEWATPTPPHGESQERGNSGVIIMGKYEVQVLDSYQNRTYADGQAAAVYGQYAPLVNASRPPGEWQTYDIVFHRPRWTDGRLTSPARVTVIHNGVLVQDDVVLTGPTGHHVRPPYEPHPDRLPLLLQDHGNPVRYRNVWVREL